jgi:hypothetical protein
MSFHCVKGVLLPQEVPASLQEKSIWTHVWNGMDGPRQIFAASDKDERGTPMHKNNRAKETMPYLDVMVNLLG